MFYFDKANFFYDPQLLFNIIFFIIFNKAFLLHFEENFLKLINKECNTKHQIRRCRYNKFYYTVSLFKGVTNKFKER